MSLDKSKVGEPEDLGDGTRKYAVHTTSFIVPKKYNLQKAIGYGAYGMVCAAKNTETDEQVAIKKIPRVFEDLVDGKRILREIKMLTFLQHENIIGIKELFKPKTRQFDDIYFASELMDTDLHQIIRSKQHLSEEHHQYFIYQVFRALKYVHSAEVLHRDLKPGNLLVNSNCDLRLCDFGLARGFANSKGGKDGDSALTEYVVTRWYRPPELLLMASHYTAAVDIWSAGCIFAELLNRKPLFPGKDYIHEVNLITDVIGVPSEEDLQLVQSEEALRYLRSMGKKKPVPMRELFPKASKLACDFLEKMLIFNPAKRMTAEQALEHPYLAQLHDPADEPSCPKKFFWARDNDELTEPELRDCFIKEIQRFHPEF
eukprot:NODE_1269_length_1497_cov_96.019337_g1054_i0.p1 GENE.NODE_1269_length_1497_cov_96.019337_g1054_i0~~NODE_1269_length_1497_cov_96.019337_g1054_i0.p1  ORF type:complete len:372 (-),score=133.15 NODE_1269_length_1497_cov_96.019337_g1054_i0:109-1224(-)